jgi:hypothetical protein
LRELKVGGLRVCRGAKECGANEQQRNHCAKGEGQSAKTILRCEANAPNKDAHGMDEPGLQGKEVLLLGSAPASQDLAKHASGTRIEIVARVAAKDDLARSGIAGDEAVDAQAIGVFGKNNVTTAKSADTYGSDNNGVAIEKIGLHALAVNLEFHSVAAAEERGTEFFEQERVPSDLWLRPVHSEWPPQRWEWE